MTDAYKKGQVVAAALNCSTASIATARGYQDVADCLRNSATPASIGAIMATYLTTTIQVSPVGAVVSPHSLARSGGSADTAVFASCCHPAAHCGLPRPSMQKLA